MYMECFYVLGELVHGLVTSSDKDTSSEAIKKADNYLQKEAKEACGPCGQDRTVINRGTSKSTEHAQSGSTAAAGPTTDMGKLMHAHMT